MKRILIVLSVFFSSSAMLLCAQELLTLEKCIEIGLDRNYAIRIVQNDERVTSNNATLGNAGYLPTVDLNGGLSGTQYSYNNHYTDGSTENPKNINNETANIGINLNWTIFDGFGIQTDYSKLKELQQKGQLNTRIAIENLTADITAEYYNLIRQRIRLKNLNYNVKLSRERLRITEVSFVVGLRSGLELQQARIYFNADSSRLLNQHETVKASLIKLNELMGLDSFNEAITVVDSIPLNMSLDESDLWQKTLSINSYLLASIKNRTISELDYKKALSRNYPYVRLNAGYGYAANWYESGTMELQHRTGFNYGITLGLNVFNGMNRQREQKNARIQMENSDLQIQNMELGLKADLAKLWMAYQNNLELRQLEKENLVIARDNYEKTSERYKVGDLAGIELREAQNSLLDAEERLSIAEYNTKLCEISLLQLSGQILTYLSE